MSEASLHGIEIPAYKEVNKREEPGEDLTVEQKAALDEAIERSKLRMIKEARQRG